MIRLCARGRKVDVSSEELKASIVTIARRHFAKHGLQGTSLKNIAHEARVAGSLINYHFQDKDGLFKACLEVFGQTRLAAITRLLTRPKDATELRIRLELFVEDLMSSVMEDPDGFAMIDHETKSGNPLIMKLFEETLLKGFKAVIEFFRQAQDQGLIKTDLDPLIIAGILFTSVCESGRKDYLSKAFFNASLTDAEYRRKFTQQLVTLFLNGVVV